MALLSHDLPARLRLGTRDLHTQTERTGFMAEMLAGRVSVPAYCLLLRNLHAIYAALESALAQRQSDAAVAMVDAPALHRTAALAADLQALHGPTWAQALPVLPATAAYVARLQGLAHSGARALLAHAYVRYLGDLHGGQVVKRLLTRTLGLQGDEGTRFYDFGSTDEVLALRLALRAGLGNLPVSADEADAIVEEARWAFVQHQRLFEQMVAPQSA
jgi:heme oxygenase